MIIIIIDPLEADKALQDRFLLHKLDQLSQLSIQQSAEIKFQLCQLGCALKHLQIMTTLLAIVFVSWAYTLLGNV